ncbi:uncharacterized protein LOC124963519 [Sciurus carolinensis]|uniref:uncharacterized protein LOC124963519 n=1 Tax=Sciurus carolinensis TaxID=30640 RepID=UPI001FB470AD|nr:uncharacterized protein LOC124963519 [Sciurus carolinensis]
MASFLFDDIGSMIQNEAIERIISSMTVKLCHLLISLERGDVKNEAFASLGKTAEDLAEASEEFVQVAKRLAGESQEKSLQEEIKPVLESLILSGRNITLVAQKLHLQPEGRCHQEELVTTAQQMLVDTTKVLLLEDAVIARQTVRAAGRCLDCLDALEAVEDVPSLRGRWAELAAALQHLGGLEARGREESLGPTGRLLRSCVPALLATARGHLRHPRDPQLAASRSRVFAATRKTLGELLGRLEPGVAGPAAGTGVGALSWRLGQLRELLAEPERLRDGLLDSPLAAVVAHCMRLAACSAPPERLRLVARCGRLLELRSVGTARSGPERPETAEQCAELRAATAALSQGVRAALLRQILDTFTDTHSPLQRLVHAAVATSAARWPSAGGDLWKGLQRFRAAFHERATQMLQVAHLVLMCWSRRQTGRDLEAAMADLGGLVARVHRLFSGGPAGSDADRSPAALRALLQAWAKASERLVACFDDVLNIPEFLSVSIQEMIKHLDFLTWALRSGDSTGFSRPMMYLQGRATHIVQVMSRYVGQDPDPIFRNGLRVLIWQLEQSSLVLGAAAQHRTSGCSPEDRDVFLTLAKQLVSSAQQVLDGLDGTNHPPILSPLRDHVQRFDIGKGQPHIPLPSLQDSTPPEWKHQRVPALGESDPATPCPPADCPSRSLSSDTFPQRRSAPLLPTSKLSPAAESRGHQAVASACTQVLQQGAAPEAAQEAGGAPLGSERMTKLQELPTLPPSMIDLAKETAPYTTAGGASFLESAPRLSGRTRESRPGRVAMAGDWYPLCQQLFCHNPKPDLPGSMAVFTELQQNLASMVQLAAKSGPMDLDKKDLDSMGHPDVLLQMQDRLEEAEIHAKQLLDTVLASSGLQAPTSWEKNIENGCLLWSVAVQDLIQNIERLSRRQSLFLLPLQQAVKNQQGLQEGLDQAADVCQRLQEAARLSSLLCGDEQVKDEISFLCTEVHVLRDALLDLAGILGSSPKPSPSLSTRFRLLCLELTLRVKTLTGHLSSINAEYERAFQDAVCPRTESSLERVISGIQAVQGIVVRGQESGPCPEDLLVALESVLILTKEVSQRVPVLQERPEVWGTHLLEWLRWEWAARAHHAVTQLQAWGGGHSKACRLLDQCLKLREEPARAPERDSERPQLHCEEGAAGGDVGPPGSASRARPGSSMGTCIAEPVVTGTPTANMGMPAFLPQQDGAPCPAARPCAELDQPALEDGSMDPEDRITKITQEMTTEVSLMAQSLRRSGRVLTKDQLITSAKKIAASGQNFTRLLRVIAENCMDQRCSQELWCALEQVQTMSSQLRIISSVKSSLARSRSSEEMLVDNAQRLLQAVSKTMRAAEAARLRGLEALYPKGHGSGVCRSVERTPSSMAPRSPTNQGRESAQRRQPHLEESRAGDNPTCQELEEPEVAAFCIQWRKELLRHRLKKPQTDCDERPTKAKL